MTTLFPTSYFLSSFQQTELFFERKQQKLLAGMWQKLFWKIKGKSANYY
jgi:hypothetical protein